MKPKKYVMLGLATLSLSAGLGLGQTNAHALASYWKSAHWVTLTQNVTVYKINNYSKHVVKKYTAHSGSYYKMNHWDVNYSWVLQSGHFNTGNKYTYTVKRARNSASWFTFGSSSSAPISSKTRVSGMKTASTNAFYFNKYTPAYLRVSLGSQYLYSSPNDALNDSGHKTKFSSIYTKVSARWNNGKKDNILRIRWNDKTYFFDNSDGEFQPYNTWIDGQVFNSPYKPVSKNKSKIVIKHGTKISKGNYWDQVKNYKDGMLVDNSYKFSHGKWVNEY